MSNNPKLSVIRDASNPNQTVDYEIYAKGLESQITIALGSDLSGSATGDLSSDLTISATIVNGKVTHDKLATDSVQNDKILQGTIALDKLAAACFGNGAVDSDNDGHIATHAQVVAYVTRLLQGYGQNYGVLSVEDINAMTLSNLNNGDLVIVGHIGEPGHSSETITLGNLTVRNGENLIFHKEGTGASVTGEWQSIDGEFKLSQTAVDAQSTSAKTLTRLEQNSNGDITATFSDIAIASSQITDKTNTYSSTGETVVTGKAIAAAISGLDAEVNSTGGTNVQVKVTEENGIITAVNVTTDNTVGKVTNATADNFAKLTASGGIADSGKSASDFATAAQGTKADSAIQGVKLSGQTNAITPDANKVVTIPNAVASDTTGATNGLMTAADKQKLDGVQSGATKVESSTTNGNIKINGTETTVYTHPSATYTAAAAVKVGQDAQGHVILGNALGASDVGITVTTDSVSDGTTTFNKYSHPAGSAASVTGLPTGNATPAFGGTFKVSQITTDSTSHVASVTERTITIPNDTATPATSGVGGTSGLMSGADKEKLNNISTGATKVEASNTNGNIIIDGADTTVYTHPTTSGNKHVPAGGSSGEFLGWTADGTAAWVANPATNKADKVSNATSGHFAGLDSTGNLTDSGKSASDFATASHKHGNIENDGTLQTSDVGVANGDKLVITDASNSDKVARSSIVFDGTTTNLALTPKGTWEPFNGASASDTNPLMDGTAAPGTSAAYSRGDHVHPTDTSREPAFTINYSANDNALVFSKAFGTVASGN